MLVKETNGCALRIFVGDIVRTVSGAMLVSVNPNAISQGQVERALIAYSGSEFTEQLDRIVVSRTLASGVTHYNGMASADGDVIVAERQREDGPYDKVLFVVDECVQPLSAIVRGALLAADALGIESVTLPAFRCGSAKGSVEPTVRAAYEQLMRGINEYMDGPGERRIKRIAIIILPGSEIYADLSKKFAFV